MVYGCRVDVMPFADLADFDACYQQNENAQVAAPLSCLCSLHSLQRHSIRVHAMH